MMYSQSSMLIKCRFSMLGLQRNLFLFDWKLTWHMGYVFIYVYVFFPAKFIWGSCFIAFNSEVIDKCVFVWQKIREPRLLPVHVKLG